MLSNIFYFDVLDAMRHLPETLIKQSQKKSQMLYCKVVYFIISESRLSKKKKIIPKFEEENIFANNEVEVCS